MTKSLLLAAIILLPRDFRRLFDRATVLAVLYIMLVASAFSLFGFILGIWATFREAGIIPMLFLTPLTFLGGTFYSIDMLLLWDTIALANPIVYLVSGLRWTFYGRAT